jgi:hypothetical protein
MAVNFLGGLFVGFIIGIAICVLFMRDKYIEIKQLDDETTDQLMELLDLADGDDHAI